MTLSVNDLLTALSTDQIRATMVSTLVGLGIPADKWRKGSSLSSMLTTIAAQMAKFSAFLQPAIAAGWLETASGGWLKLLAFFVYGVTVPSATFASGNLTLVNSGGGVFSYGAGQAVFKDSTTGQTYTNEAPFTLPGSSTLTIVVNATERGSVGSAAPGGIDTLVTSMLGVTVSNPTALVGTDAPSDPAIRQLCLDKLGALSVRGPRTAYAYAVQVALNAVTGAPVNINRWSITPSSHTGTVAVVVASPTGAADANDVAGVVTSIETGVPGLSPPFTGVRPDAVTVTVASAVPIVYASPPGNPFVVWAQALPGLDVATVQAAVDTAVENFFATYPIGGLAKGSGGASGVWASGLDGAIRAAHPAIFAVDGPFDLALLPNQVATDSVFTQVRLVPYAGNG